MENALQDICGEFARRAASTPVANYAVAQLRHVQNPKTSKFIEIAESFKADWRTELELYANAEGCKEATDSIMAFRHEISRGESFTANISFVQIKDYLEKAIEVIEQLEAYGLC